MTPKKLVDNIGSIDDFGVSGGYDPATLRKEPSSKPSNEESDGYIIKWENGENDETVKPFIVESRETRKGIQKTVYPLMPFCRWCSPAARREDDSEWTSGWSEEGAEVRMHKREARLVGLSPEEHYSFTLVEIKGEVICNVCEQSPLVGKEIKKPIMTVKKPIESNPVVFDVHASQFGIRAEGSVIRIPESLVAKWVAKDQLKSGDLVIGDGEKLYSLSAPKFLETAVWDETNKEWILSVSKCKLVPALIAELDDDRLTINQDRLISWRKTALSVKHLVAANDNGLTYTTSLQEFLVGGYSEGSSWVFDIDNCSGPYFMDLEWLLAEDEDLEIIESEKQSKQTDILDF